MARTISLNFKKMNQELTASDSAIDPLLVAAKITTLKVDGREVPAAEAPLPVKIAAIGALMSTGDKTADSAELIAANSQMAGQVETLEGQLTAANATISGQTQKIVTLEGQLATANASVTKLTAELGTSENLLKASNSEVARLTGSLNTQKAALAQRCIAVNCLDLTALGVSATSDKKLEYAMSLPQEDLFKAYNGAVNLAMRKTGVSAEDVPAGRPSGPGAEKPQLKGRERFTSSVRVEMAGSPVNVR